MDPKGPNMEPTRAQMEPKGFNIDQKGAERGPNNIEKSMPEKRSALGHSPSYGGLTFWSFLGEKVAPNIDFRSFW